MNYYKIAIEHAIKLIDLHSAREYDTYLSSYDYEAKAKAEGLSKASQILQDEVKHLKRIHREDVRQRRAQRANSKGKQEVTNDTTAR